MAAASSVAGSAARYLQQFSHQVYDNVSEQLKIQAAASLPQLAVEYLQVHAQRGEDERRAQRYEPAADWVELDHLQVDTATDDDGWNAITEEDTALAVFAVGAPVPLSLRGRKLTLLDTLWQTLFSPRLLAWPVDLSIKLSSVALRAVAATAGGGFVVAKQLSGYGPRLPFPSIGVPAWDRFEEERVYVHGEERWFKVWLPFEDNVGSIDDQPPIVVLLHGYRECGWDNHWQCSSGLGTLLQDPSFAEKFPAVVVLPQLPRKPWDANFWKGWTEPEVQDVVMAQLNLTLRKYRCDSRRVYLVGESLGGEGVWHLARRFPSTFAGVGATCGSLEPYDWNSWEWGDAGDVYQHVSSSAMAPFWFCHGTADPYVPVEHPRQLAASLNAARSWRAGLSTSLLRMFGLASSAEVVFKEYEGDGHEVWTRAYLEDDLLEWLFRQRL